MKVTALVPAAGHGARVGANQNKILLPLCGVPVIVWTLRALEQSPSVENIVVIARSQDMTEMASLLQQHPLLKPVEWASGGPQRQDSVYNGLHQAKRLNEIAIVHDAARPLATPELVERVCRAAMDVGGATAAVAVTDTLTRSDENLHAVKTIPRENLWRIQTPQAFLTSSLLSAHNRARDQGFRTTDDATIVQHYGGMVRIVPGEAWNIKVTEPSDFQLAEALLRPANRR